MERYKEIKSVLIYVLILNLLVAAAKLIFGFLANSLSMMADAAHSFFDSMSNIIGLVAIRIASKPPDKEHPYGHAKYENFATIGIAILIFLVCIEIIRGAIARFLNPVRPDIEIVTFIIMIITLAVNLFISRHESKKGEELNSYFLMADATHTKTDVFVSISVILGFFAVELGYPVFDSIIALVIALLIGKMGYEIIKQSSDVLCDTSKIDEERIRNIISKIPGVGNCHKIRTRGTENDIYIDLHLIMDPHISVEDGHNISHKVIEKLKSEIKEIKDVTVHIEPR